MTDTQQSPAVPARGFRSGAAAAKEGTGFAASRAGFFKIADGELAFVQFVTDPWEWQTVDMHSMVKTKGQPADWEGNWPDSVTPVCRLNKMGDGMPMFPECYVCEFVKQKDGKPFKRSSRTWALGVLREEVLGDGSPEQGGPQWLGRRRGFRNKMIEMAKLGPDGQLLKGPDGKPTGETELRPEVVIFPMGWKNFFQAVQGAAQVNGGTITNLTFAIQRSGTQLETQYSVTSMGAGKQDFNDPKYAEKIGVKVDWEQRDAEGHPLKIYPAEYDIPKMLMHRASDEFYARFIDPRVTLPSSGKKAEPKPSNDVEPENLKSMRERIMGWSEANAPEGGAPADAPQSEPPDSGADSDLDVVGGAAEGGMQDFDEA
jgi:hypothetical protein